MLSWSKHVWNSILLVGEGRFHISGHFTIGGWQTCKGKKLLSVPTSDWSLSESREALPSLWPETSKGLFWWEMCLLKHKAGTFMKEEIILTGRITRFVQKILFLLGLLVWHRRRGMWGYPEQNHTRAGCQIFTGSLRSSMMAPVRKTSLSSSLKFL